MTGRTKRQTHLSPPRLAGKADPTEVAAPIVSGGLGGTPDGTQVPHHSPTAVPGKPMAPIADAPSGNDPLNEQAMDRGSGDQPIEPGEELMPIDGEPAPAGS